MRDEQTIRFANFKRLCADKKLDARKLAEHPRLKGGYNFWHALLNSDSNGKCFGERRAREIEEAFNLPRGTLDDTGAAAVWYLDPVSEDALKIARKIETLEPSARDLVYTTWVQMLGGRHA